MFEMDDDDDYYNLYNSKTFDKRPNYLYYKIIINFIYKTEN